MKVIYRITDAQNQKEIFLSLTKKDFFNNFYNVFKDHDIYIIADNVIDETINYLSNYISPDKIIRTNLGNSQSLLFAINFAITNFNDNEYIYFAEDDYIYTPYADKIIEEGLSISDYCSGYDHPDKYKNYNKGGNSLIINEGELTRVIISNNHHWKYTISLCMTFATRVKTIKEDFNTFIKNCATNYPNDFNIFLKLRENRKIITSIPAVCTHGEAAFLAPFIDWSKYLAE